MVRKKLIVWLPLLFSIVMIVGMWIGYQLRENISGGISFLKNDKTNSLQEVIDLVQRNYVDKVSIDTIQNNAIDDLLSHLDPHSVYIPASELEEVNEDLQGNFQGIGIEFNIFKDTVTVVNVIPDGPSYKAGLQIGDQIIKVNDTVSLVKKNINLDDIRNNLRGPGGSSVKITILRDGVIKNFIIQRGTIALPSVDVNYMIAPQTGFIRINKFAETTYQEFMVALENLQKQGMQKLILDLRGNGGGLVNEATNIADEFLDDDKLIVYTKGANTQPAEYRCKKDGLFEKGKLVVLVDETTASASEILAGALQDWDRATIIGRRTFGKGLVQEQFNLSDGSALRLTVARYYTPLGRNIQKPYNKGKEQYEEELINRFHNGELVVGDTAKPKGHAFKTSSGHLVYGGGGITPDIFVPFDTTTQPKAVVDLFIKGTLNEFVYDYYKQNKSVLQNIKSPVDLSKQFVPDQKDWQQLNDYAKKDSINLDTISAKAKSNLLKQLQAFTARQVWQTEGFIEVENLTDPVVQKALQFLR